MSVKSIRVAYISTNSTGLLVFFPLFNEFGDEIINGIRVEFSNNVCFCQWLCSPKWKP